MYKYCCLGQFFAEVITLQCIIYYKIFLYNRAVMKKISKRATTILYNLCFGIVLGIAIKLVQCF